MKRIAFINQKGGCGKSTSLFHIAGELAARGSRVLIVDTDKQLDTTNNFLAEEESEYDAATALTIIDYLNGSDFSEVVKKNYIRVGNCKPAYKGIDVLPSDVRLDDQTLVRTIISQNENISALFDTLDYDYILIDCPPSNTAVEELVLGHIATDVVTPMTCDSNAVRGCGSLLNRIENMRVMNPTLNMCGVFLPMFRSNISKHKEYRAFLASAFGHLFFDTAIPMSADVVAALEDRGQPLAFYHKCRAKESVSALVDELLSRI